MAHRHLYFLRIKISYTENVLQNCPVWISTQARVCVESVSLKLRETKCFCSRASVCPHEVLKFVCWKSSYVYQAATLLTSVSHNVQTIQQQVN